MAEKSKVMFESEELSPETQMIANEVMGLREQNHNLIAKIEKFGASIETAEARLEFILLGLVDLGIMTVADMWNLNLAWERNLRPQLKEKLEMVQHMRAEQIRKSGKTESGLIVPRR